MNVRTKLIAILIVPLAVLAGLAATGMRQRGTERDQAERAHQLVALGRAVTPVAEALQAEAVRSALFTASDGTLAVDELGAQRAATDQALDALGQHLRRTDLGSLGADLTAALEPVGRAGEAVGVTRSTVDGRGEGASNAATVFQQQASQVIDVLGVLAREAAGTELAGDVSAWVALTRIAQLGSEEQALVATALLRGQAEGQQWQRVQELATEVVQQRGIFAAVASPGEREVFRQVMAPGGLEAARVLAGVTFAETEGAPGELTTTSLEQWTDWTAQRLDGLRAISDGLAVRLADQSAETAATAATSARAYLLLSAAAAAFSLLTALLLGRSITRPLRRLTDAARAVADHQLPALVETLRDPKAAEPQAMATVERTSGDEIGDLAEAFGNIQRVAVAVAHEQAALMRKGIGDLFVNLARRNQSLLDRQIAFLDELEANETDPEDLEHLFKLDHLATRMRRNAESLLVLAGVEAPRRWGRPVPLADVVRAAVGEVEDYGRIHVRGLDDVKVQGGAAADMAHLVSELLDNAAQFSPPGTPVEVDGRLVGEGDDRRYVVRVADGGIGMNAAQLAEANRTLADPPVTGITLSRSLGFTVVGRLADRHGIAVRLEPGADSGVVVTVELPGSLLVDEGAAVAGSAPTAPLDTAGPSARLGASGWTRPSDVPAAVWARITESPARRTPVARPEPVVATLAEALPSAAASARELTQPERRTPAADRDHPGRPDEADGGPSVGGLPRRRAAPSPEGAGPAAVGRRPAGAFTPSAPPAPAPMPSRPAAPTGPSGLPRRLSQRSAVDGGASAPEAGAVASARTPEEIRAMLSSYRSGLDRGRRSPAPGPDGSDQRTPTGTDPQEDR